MNAQEIRDLFKRHNVPLSRDDVWEVQGTPVVLHKALERLAVVLGIEWGPPQILRAERDEAVLIATGKIADGQPEWSIGEALLGQNYRPGKSKRTGEMVAAYPYAMAEKRAKDRVILKLAGLHGAYSEEEADDFKQSQPKEASESEKPSSKEIYIKKAIKRMNDFESASGLLAWAKDERKKVWPQYGIEPHDEDGQKFVEAYKDRMAVLDELAGDPND